MEYKVVKGNEPDELSKAVNKHIAEGWELYGNLCVALGQGVIYAQAMIKGDEPIGSLGLGIASPRR
jgi:hypothetical protein